MHYLIQENIFRERNYNLILHHLERMQLSYDIVSILPFTNTIQKRVNDEGGFEDFKTDKKNIFCFGSVKFAHISKEHDWYPGSMFNGNHDFEIYSKFYNNHLLNSDCIIQKLSDKIPDSIPELFFARPTRDTKIFSGGVFMRDSWYEMVDVLLVNNKKNYDSLKMIENDLVMFSKLKTITNETRCWVVGGKVITMSEYKRGNFVSYKNVDHNEILKDKVQYFVDLYKPAEAFVIDVCETIDSDDIKIVEINCINCAGFYEGNLPKVINELENLYNI